MLKTQIRLCRDSCELMGSRLFNGIMISTNKHECASTFVCGRERSNWTNHLAFRA